MRLSVVLAAALGLASISVTALPTAEVHAQDNSAFKDKYTVAVSRTGEQLKVVITGLSVTEANAPVQWYVNTEYPLTVKLAAGAAVLGKAELTKTDATLEGTEVTGKAKKATFTTTIKGADKVTASFKIVVCSATSCSPPIKGEAKEP